MGSQGQCIPEGTETGWICNRITGPSSFGYCGLDSTSFKGYCFCKEGFCSNGDSACTAQEGPPLAKNVVGAETCERDAASCHIFGCPSDKGPMSCQNLWSGLMGLPNHQCICDEGYCLDGGGTCALNYNQM